MSAAWTLTRSRLAMLLLVVSMPFIMWGVLTTVGHGADHRDGPIFINTAANGQRDINDVYIFQSPANKANTVMAVTIQPFAGAATPVTFDPNVVLDIHVDNTGSATEALIFRMTFGAPDPNTGAQSVVLRGLPAAKFPALGLLARGNINQAIPMTGGGMFQAGIFDDPFFFVNSSGSFKLFLDSVVQNGQQLFSDTLTPFTFPNGVEQAHYAGQGPINFFGPNVNTMGVVIEIPSVKLQSTPTNTNIGIWATTSVNGVQLDRMGRPAINTALIPPVPRIAPSPLPMGFPQQTLVDRRTAFNQGIPSNDRKNFGSDVLAVLTNPYGPYVQTPANAQVLVNIVLPDILTFNTASSAGFLTGPLNGRKFTDPVVDLELSVLTLSQPLVVPGRVQSMLVTDDNGNRITDGTMFPSITAGPNPRTVAFPYMGPANNPAQNIGTSN